MHARGVTAAVTAAAAIGVVAGAVGSWEADWAVGRNRKPAAKVIYAVVRSDGLLRGKGATDAEKTTTGTYAVTFDRQISQCAWVATPIELGLATTIDSNVSTTVRVETFTEDGNAVDRTFSLQVAC